MASPQKLSRLESGGLFVVQVGGDGCGSLLLVFVGCSVVVCFSCVDAVLQCVQCASCACCGRSHHYRGRNGDAATMCVSLFAAPPSRSLLPFSSPLGVQICSPNSATLILLLLLLLLLARVREERWRWLYGACGSKDSGVHWRLVGERNWTACRTGKKPDSRDLTEEEAFNAIFCDFAARSCSDYGGTNNSVGTEEYMSPDLTTPNTSDGYSDGTASMVLEHPPPPPRCRQTAVRAAAPHRAHLL
ncbi:hypothetical protein TcG_08246 [Trypanosoma cruzi]|nr:hypothetical protein TcG_08246 [Trypanosoma cruzi]